MHVMQRKVAGKNHQHCRDTDCYLYIKTPDISIQSQFKKSPSILNVICLQKNSQYSFEPQFINIIEDVECHLFVKTHNILLSHNL